MEWKTMQEYKLSYMQMQEWITTMYLMARARVFCPERDYPYLGFGHRHLMEMLVATLSSAIGRVISISFFPIPEISYIGYSALRSVGYTP